MSRSTIPGIGLLIFFCSGPAIEWPIKLVGVQLCEGQFGLRAGAGRAARICRPVGPPYGLGPACANHETSQAMPPTDISDEFYLLDKPSETTPI